MQIGRQRSDIAMRGNEVVAHVVRVGGRVAHSPDPGTAAAARIRACEPDRSTVAVEPMIGVDVLSDQHDFAHARVAPAGRFRRVIAPTGREDSRAARIRHDAERAELVAALLDRHEGGAPRGWRPPRAGSAADAQTCPRPGSPCRSRRIELAPCATVPAGDDSFAGRRRRRPPAGGAGFRRLRPGRDSPRRPRVVRLPAFAAPPSVPVVFRVPSRSSRTPSRECGRC